jgi:hypothetical protein
MVFINYLVLLRFCEGRELWSKKIDITVKSHMFSELPVSVGRESLRDPCVKFTGFM